MVNNLIKALEKVESLIQQEENGNSLTAANYAAAKVIISDTLKTIETKKLSGYVHEKVTKVDLALDAIFGASHGNGLPNEMHVNMALGELSSAINVLNTGKDAAP